MKAFSVLCLLVIACAVNAAAVECEPEYKPAPGSYDFVGKSSVQYALGDDLQVGDVHVTTLPVFDEDNPRENNAVYRFANRIHIVTRPRLIRDLLLFEEGESFDQRMIDETVRLLRNQDYLYDADIRPVSQCDDRVDLEVITRDVWSLTVDLSFDRSGGENEFGIGVRDTNLLGWGNELSLRTKQDDERDTTELAYKDDNLRGTRLKTRLRYADSDDGSEHFALLELPFYELDSRRAWTLSFRQKEEIDTLYYRSDDIAEVVNESESYRVSYGFSKGLINGVARRWALGYWYRSNEFSVAEELPPPDEFPEDRELSFPYLEYSSVEDNFVERININQIGRVEDLHVGRRFYTRLGYADDSLGGDATRFVYEGAFSDTLYYSSRHLLRHRFAFSGLLNLDEHKSEDVLADYELQYIFSPNRRISYLIDLHGIYSRHLNPNQQVVLGGDTGLRAFENRLQVGDRRFSLNLERRTFTDIHFFNLIRLGWAFFIDVGRAWEPGVDTDFEDDYMANVGFGLRLASSKADIGRILHIDLAVPLTNRDDPDVDSSLVSVRLTNRF